MPVNIRTDIQNREDIERLINAFYTRVKSDALIGSIFEKANVNWKAHMPIMYDFWEGIVFNKGRYKGNPIQLHQHLHTRIPLSKTDFEKWLQLFTGTVDELFTGANSELIKQRAISIAMVMQLKIFHTQTGLNPGIK